MNKIIWQIENTLESLINRLGESEEKLPETEDKSAETGQSNVRKTKTKSVNAKQTSNISGTVSRNQTCVS